MVVSLLVAHASARSLCRLAPVEARPAVSGEERPGPRVTNAQSVPCQPPSSLGGPQKLPVTAPASPVDSPEWATRVEASL